MSRTIDERVVSMQFDNKQFESNVRTSLSTLDKLKQSLNLSGAAKGFEDINAAAKKCNLAPMSNAVETVRVKFSALEVMAVTALSNITNSAVNAGKRIVKSLTIDPVKMGFSEYETQINAVQTILANTQSKGTTLDDVNRALDELNTYADKTIYNFTEMTRNIGTFTAAGVDLDTATNAIQGIANLAAVSGSTSQQASTAMYQLSQALASGTVKLMDWNSVVNAGMGGQVFQDALKETARVHGVAIDDMIKKNGSFRETLREEWLTSEILTETLQKFTLTTEGLNEQQIEANRQMLKSKGYTEQQIEEIFKLGETATNAATKVKTFTQLMDTLKEAAQSGWTQSWELIVGDFEEAKKLWTGVSDFFGGMIGRSADRRNNLLSGALKSNWEKMIDKVTEAGVSVEDFEATVKKTAKENGYPIDQMIKDWGDLETVIRDGHLPLKILKKSLDNLSDSSVDLSEIVPGLKKGETSEKVTQLQTALEDLGITLDKYGVDGIFGSETEAALKAFQERSGLEVTGVVDDATLKALEEATSKTLELDESLWDLVDGVKELGGRELLIEAFKNIGTAIFRPFQAIGKAWRETFSLKPEHLYNFISGFKSLTDTLVMSEGSAEKIGTAFKGLFSILEIVATIAGGGVRWAFKGLQMILEHFDLNILDVAAAAGEAMTNFRDWLFENNKLAKGFEKVIGALVEFGKAAWDWINAFVKTPEVQEKIEAIRTAFSEGFSAIGKFFSAKWSKVKEFFAQFKDIKSLKDMDFGAIFKNVKNGVVKWFQNFDLKNIFSNFSDAFKNARTAIGDFLGKIGEKFGITAEKFEAFKTKIKDFFTTIKEKLGDNKGSIIALGSLITIGYLLIKIKNLVSKITNPFENISESFSGLIDSFAAVQKAKANKLKTEAIKNIATSITLLAGALWIIAQIPKEDIWRAVGVMGIMAGGILAMALLLKIIDSKIQVPKGANSDITAIGNMIAKFGIALILMAASIKILGEMDNDVLKQGGIVVGAFFALVITMMAISKKMNATDADKFGKMLRKLATSLLVLSLVVLIFGKMDTKTLIQGGAAVGIFLLSISSIMRGSDYISKNANEFGKMIRKIATSLLILSLVVLIFGKMDTKTLIQGGLAVTAFLGIMIGAMKLTKSISKDTASFGKMMFGLSAGLIMMALAVKILGSMDTKTLVKGGIAALAFVGITAMLMDATKLMGKYSFNAGKMGLLLLSFAASMILMAGAIAALSMIDGSDITKAVAAITGIGLIFGGLLYVTKFAKNVNTGTLIGLSIAIAVMAASIAALSFIPTKDLAKATIALGSIIGVFALLVYSLKSIENLKIGKTMLTLGAMVVIVGLLAFILYKLADNSGDADKALKVSTAISELIIALSGAAALLAIASKYGPKTTKGLGVMAATIGIVALVAGAIVGIAIWQLPNIADQLSNFMKRLGPFIEGANSIDADMFEGLKTLAEAILMFTGAGGIFAIADLISLGGVSRAFSSFISFIQLVIPVVSKLAKDVSGEDINMDNLNGIVDAIVGLAEAASKIPNTTIAAFGSKWGGGGVISIANLSSFTNFIKQAVPIIKDMALGVSAKGVSINTKNLEAIVNTITGLAEAADKVPTVDIGGAFGKFAGGWGVGVGISWTDLKGFKTFVSAASEAMLDFASDLEVEEIDTSTIENIGPLCEAIKVLAEAAGAVPSETITAWGSIFGKFKGGGVGSTYSYTDLDDFATWIGTVLPIVGNFARNLDIDKLNSEGEVVLKALTTDNLTMLTSMCEAIKLLGEAAGAAPKTTIGGFGGGGKGIGAGGAYISIPLLGEFTEWIAGVLPVMADFTRTIKGNEDVESITEKDVGIAKSICEAVSTLSEAMEYAPKATVGVFGGGGYGVGVGGGFFQTERLTAFKDWISEVLDILPGFAVDMQEVNLTDSQLGTIESLCGSVATIAEAASLAPKDTYFVSLLGGYLNVSRLGEFKDWVSEIVPMLAEMASGTYTDSEGNTVTLSNIPEANLTTLQSIAQAAKTVAEAAKLAPTTEEYSGIFGNWVETTDIKSTVDWFSDVYDLLTGLVAKIAENPVDQSSLETLSSIANTAKTLSSSILDVVVAQQEGGYDVDTLSSHFQGVALAMQSFAAEINKIEDIDTTKISTIATAAKNASDALLSMSNFPYDSVDTVTFGTKLDELVTAIDDFEISGDNIDSSITQVQELAAMLGGLVYIDYSGVSSFQTALDKLGKTSINAFIKLFVDSAEKVKSAVISMVNKAATGVNTDANISKFKTAGKDLANGLISGINSKKQAVYDAAYALGQKAVQGEKDGQASNSPSKLTIKAGKWFGEGLVIGINRMANSVYSAGHSLGRTAVDSISSTVSRVADAINTDIDTQPTIRPVLDLSEVSAGAGTISSMFSNRPSLGVLSNVGTINAMMNNRQNGTNGDVISAINELGKKLGNGSGNTYHIDGITYDDGSNIADAIQTITRAARVERRR